MVTNYTQARLVITAAALLTLNACQTTQPAIEVREIEVPVPQPCLTQEQLAELPEPDLIGDRLGRTPETAEADRDILAATNLRLRAWGRTLYFANVACAE